MHFRVSREFARRQTVGASFPAAVEESCCVSLRLRHQIDWVARASRVLAMTSRHRGLLWKDCFGVTPKPTRETRALPTVI
ncbi:MAG: hypothetical protein DME32_03560 [Verrucomicrobia bacterium]|nr:MAG: hypothetical protein DME32_03560 [Verrucomicrobiota bacterium]